MAKKETREARSPRPTRAAPTIEDLLAGARDLAEELEWIADGAEKARTLLEVDQWLDGRRRGLTEAVPAPTLLDGTKAMVLIGGADEWQEVLRECVGPFLALRHRNNARRVLAKELAAVSAAFVHGKLTWKQARESAQKLRSDEAAHITESAMQSALTGKRGRRRTPREKCRAVYAVVAWGADVDPRPNIRRGQNDDLGRLLDEALDPDLVAREFRERLARTNRD